MKAGSLESDLKAGGQCPGLGSHGAARGVAGRIACGRGRVLLARENGEQPGPGERAVMGAEGRGCLRRVGQACDRLNPET